jgi:hypothetical protein
MASLCQVCKEPICQDATYPLCKRCLHADAFQLNINLTSGCKLFNHPPFGATRNREVYIYRPGCERCIYGRVIISHVFQVFAYQCIECEKYNNDFAAKQQTLTTSHHLTFRVWRLRIQNEIRKRTEQLESILMGDMLTNDWKTKVKENVLNLAPPRPIESSEFVRFKRGWAGLTFRQQDTMKFTDGSRPSIVSTKKDLPSIGDVPF